MIVAIKKQYFLKKIIMIINYNDFDKLIMLKNFEII